MKFEFSNSKYIWAHGKAPRGGYGFWIFWTPNAPQEIVASGTLTEAKRICIQKLKAQGIAPCTVYVMP